MALLYSLPDRSTAVSSAENFINKDPKEDFPWEHLVIISTFIKLLHPHRMMSVTQWRELAQHVWGRVAVVGNQRAS
jgi:hypothetical protein